MRLPPDVVVAELVRVRRSRRRSRVRSASRPCPPHRLSSTAPAVAATVRAGHITRPRRAAAALSRPTLAAAGAAPTPSPGRCRPCLLRRRAWPLTRCLHRAAGQRLGTPALGHRFHRLRATSVVPGLGHLRAAVKPLLAACSWPTVPNAKHSTVRLPFSLLANCSKELASENRLDKWKANEMRNPKV